MSYNDYLQYKVKFNDLLNFDKININLKSDYYKKSNSKTIIKPILTTINCVKIENSKDYECEKTEYSLKICIRESNF